MYVFFDTETTGLPRDPRAPASDVGNWPRVVQIAWLVTDSRGAEIKARSHIIQPDGFEIPPDAARIHGITTAVARRRGIGLKGVLEAFAGDVSAATTLVAHNYDFDSRVVSAEFYRLAYRSDMFAGKSARCTMRSSTSYCRLPGGPRGYKWPTLDELHRKLFGETFDAAHDAAADVRACARCFFELGRLGIDGGEENDEEDVGGEDDDEFDDQALFDDIYAFAEDCPWFDTGRFVDDVYEQFESRGRISEAQRAALARIRDMLEDKIG